MDTKPIIAIDGPAASGKGTLARALAVHLRFAHMDTGALYRAVGYTVLQSGGDPQNEEDVCHALESLVESNDLPALLEEPAIRTDEVGQAASIVAAYPFVRKALIDIQRNFGRSPGEGYEGAVLDGRDIGTVIFPEADVKLFITADVGVRAERRRKELQSRGIPITYEAVLKDMRSRDDRDARRANAPMVSAKDAVVIDTADLTAEEVLQKALAVVRENLS